MALVGLLHYVRIPVLTALLVGLELFVALWWGPMLWTQLRVTVGTELEIRVLVRTIRIPWHSVTALTGGEFTSGLLFYPSGSGYLRLDT